MLCKTSRLAPRIWGSDDIGRVVGRSEFVHFSPKTATDQGDIMGSAKTEMARCSRVLLLDSRYRVSESHVISAFFRFLDKTQMCKTLYNRARKRRRQEPESTS